MVITRSGQWGSKHQGRTGYGVSMINGYFFVLARHSLSDDCSQYRYLQIFKVSGDLWSKIRKRTVTMCGNHLQPFGSQKSFNSTHMFINSAYILWRENGFHLIWLLASFHLVSSFQSFYFQIFYQPFSAFNSKYLQDWLFSPLFSYTVNFNLFLCRNRA